MRIVLTGPTGFLGWHTRLRLAALTDHDVIPIGRDEWDDLPAAVADADAVIHIAGANRGDDAHIEATNVGLATDVGEAIARCPRSLRVVHANSIQSGYPGAYGRSKDAAARLLRAATVGRGGHFVDVLLPNLFGEGGRPNYNSFVATFVAALRDDTTPVVGSGQVRLLHVQEAAGWLLEGLISPDTHLRPDAQAVAVREVYTLLRDQHDRYRLGEIPDLSTALSQDLFNTYRAAQFPERDRIPLRQSVDHRGYFMETVRVHGGQAQVSLSTTVPGVTRGNHYHLRKVERFVVVGGQATISLRRMFTDDVHDVEVTGTQPCAVDIPTGWAHSLTNTGSQPLLTLFWSSDLFSTAAPDTYAHPVKEEAVV